MKLLHPFALILCLFTVGCNDTNKGILESKHTVYDKVISQRTIRVGYLPYPPALIKDPNSKKLSGIFIDVLNETAKNLDFKLEIVEEVTFATMIESVKAGRVDIICSAIWPTSQRGKFADFTVPLYYSPVKAYVRFGNAKFDGNLSKVNSENTTISTLDGEMTSLIAKIDYPNAKISSVPQSSDISQLMLDVATGKSDITFIESVVANDFIKNNPNRIQEVKDVDVVRVFPNVMMVKKGETDFLSMINVSLTEIINNGVVNRIIDKYEPHPNSFLRVAIPYKK